MKRFCPYFALVLWCCAVPAVAGPFKIPTVSKASYAGGPFSIPDKGPFDVNVPDLPKYRTVTRYRSESYTETVLVPCSTCPSGYRYAEVQKTRKVAYQVNVLVTPEQAAKSAAAAAGTPMADVNRMVKFVNLPKNSLILEPGAGADARIVIALAKAGYRVLSYEIDPERCKQANAAVKAAGVSGRVVVQLGDVTKYDNRHVDAVVGYMYPEVMDKIAKSMQTATNLKRVITYMHPVAGLTMQKYDDIHVWSAPAAVAAVTTRRQRGVEYGGSIYYGRVCNNRNCQMCNYISANLR